MKYFILSVFFIPLHWAYSGSYEYSKGAFLIYNCLDKHWACVAASETEVCQKSFDEKTKQNKLYHSCVVLGELPSIKSCEQKTLLFTSQNLSKNFCVNDFWKDKALTFN